jgi:hypothetical protein
MVEQAPTLLHVDEKVMSLPRCAVPCATDPNTLTFRAPCRAAICRIWLRLD